MARHSVVVRSAFYRVRTLGSLALALAAAGCAQGGATNGDPGARPLPPGQTCQSIRSELNSLDGKGVPSLIESRQAGRKLNPQQNALADRYNELLNYYLGGRCHV